MAGRAFGTGRLPFRRRRRPKALPAASALCLLAAALAVLAELGPAEAPYRTPAVRAALERAGRASPTAAAVSLAAAPRLALPRPGTGDPQPASLPAPAAEPPPGPDEPPTAAPAPPSAAEATPPARAREQVAAAPVAVIVRPPPPRVALPRPGIRDAQPAFRPTAPPAADPAERPAAVPPAAEAPPPAPAPEEVTAAPAAVIVRPPPPRVAPPRLAVMLDDLGLDPAAARRAIDLPPGVTLDFLPYGRGLDRLTAAAAARGHDVFLHLPLEPVGDADPGPNALLTGLAPAEVARRLAWAFGRLPGAVGVNNHMGSRGTADPGLMLAVLAEVARRGLVFVDSRTTPFSVAPGIAGRLGLPFAARDVFLDNEPTAEAVQARLAEAERVARRHGGAIAIGHPYPATLAVLAGWLPDAERRGVRLVTARSLARVGGCAGVVAVAAAGGC